MSFKGAWIWSCSVALAACAPFAGAGSAPPRLDHPELAAGGVVARFGDAAELRIGEHDAGLRAVSIGRGEARTALTSAPVTALGAEVSAERAPGIVEWWRQLAGGLEHGVTVAERPAGEGELTLALEVTGLGVRSAGDDAVELTDAEGTAVATYAHLVVTDARGRVLPASMRASSGGIDIGVVDAGAVYPVVIDPIVVAREATLTARPIDVAAADTFGRSVAISGDGTRALIGVPGGDAAGSNAGLARVFVRTGTMWTEEAMLVAPDAASGDSLGIAVALSADGSRAFVGASGDDVGAVSNAGSTRVFVRSGTSWTHETTLTAMGAAADLGLGGAIAASSDGTRVVVGGNGGLSGIGSARVFVRVGSAWSEEASLLGTGITAGELFGSSVAIASDGSRALVGAPVDSAGAISFSGSVSVFVRATSSWTLETTLTAVDRDFNDSFGGSVALSADGSRALVGVSNDDSGSGSGRVFLRTGSSWVPESTLVPGDRAAGDNVGTAVALSADATRAVLGAPYDSPSGSARVFVRAGSVWTEGGTLTYPGADAAARFGGSIASTADGGRVLVGAFLSDAGALTDVGSAMVYTVLATAGTVCSSSAAGACASGFCVDGVCCDTACGGGASDCQACSIMAGGGFDGTCGPLTVTAAAITTCRAQAGPCDEAELCLATSTTCPPDGFRPSTEVCRSAGGLCDVAERCTGTSGACPADLAGPAGPVCRPVAGACDVQEYCDGASPECPVDRTAAADTVCRPSLGACDPTEACDGTSTACPADVLAPMGTVCGVGMGDCATPGTCTGSSPLCPSSGARPSGTLCRTAISACDVDDFCDGTSQVCTDAFAPADQACGGAPSGVCDAQDHCTGTSGDCMPAYLAGVECRASTGECDPEEVCAGGSADCPPDSLSPSGTVCRASTASCDPVESCDGTAASCPADQNTCSSDGGGTDGGVPSDAGGSADGGPPTPAAGCTCRVAGRASAPVVGWIALLVALVARRR